MKAEYTFLKYHVKFQPLYYLLEQSKIRKAVLLIMHVFPNDVLPLGVKL